MLATRSRRFLPLVLLTPVALTAATWRWSSAPSGAPSHAMAPVRPVPRPSFARFDGTSRTEVLAYARALTFDTSYHAIDTRRLMVRKEGHLEEGPIATVAPEIGVTAMTFTDMRAGRIVARVTTDAAFPAQGYGKGDNYVWVDDAKGTLRAVIIPADPAVGATEVSYRIMHEAINPPGTRPEARFRWNDQRGLEDLWVECDTGCCLVGHG